MVNPIIGSHLLGTNEERDKLRNELNCAYCKPLAKDMEKGKSNEKCKWSKSEQISDKRENATILMEVAVDSNSRFSRRSRGYLSEA